MNPSIADHSARHLGPTTYAGFATDASRANRRRLRVFLGTLIVALTGSLAYTFLRAPEYRATARLDITPGVGSVAIISSASQPAPAPSDSPKSFLTDVQVLTSRPVLERAAGLLQKAGRDLASFGPDTVEGIQARIEARPVPDTNVVELIATNAQPDLTAPLINAIIDVYRAFLDEAYQGTAGDALARAEDEAKKLEATVAAKRREVEAYRLKYNIVSLERGENEILARVKNQSTSLATANERVATAEGKLRSLTESAAAGKTVVRARDDPTLASLEQRVSQAREELRDLERSYTPEYLAKDPRAIAMRTRIAEMERQLKAQREVSSQSAILEAQQDLASAQEAARRLQSQVVNDRQQVGEFTTRFNEYKARQDDLSEIEAAYRTAVQRKVKLEASERARRPSVKVLEAAVTPQQPWRPLYLRDAAISVGGSLLLALLAMWLVELFNKPGQQPAVVIAQSLGGLPYVRAPQVIGVGEAPVEALSLDPTPLLPEQPALPRELGTDEAAALLRAADATDRVAIMLLLSGVSPDELATLRWGDVDGERGVVNVPGASARTVTMPDALRRLLAAQPGHGADDWLAGPPDRAAFRDAIDTRLLCVAHDAGLDAASTVTAGCLRHSYITYLLRQGIRFADLTKIVGALPRAALAQYSAFSATERKSAAGEVDPTHPAIRASSEP